MRYSYKKTLLFILLICTFIEANAQFRSRKKNFAAGLSIQAKGGINFFYGDLVSKNRHNYSLGIVALKDVSYCLDVRADLEYGSLRGTQYNEGQTDYFCSFENNYYSFSAGVSFRLLDYINGLLKDRLFNPYIIGQFGVIYYDADESFGPAAVAVYPDLNKPEHWRTEKGFAPILGLGCGCRLYINKKWAAHAEWVGVLPITDLLDAHEIWYKNRKNSGPYIQTDDNDYYYVGTVGVSYTFGASDWRNRSKYKRKTIHRRRPKNSHKKKKYNIRRR